MNELLELCKKHKARKHDFYMEEYWRFLKDVRLDVRNFLEIGVAQGYSIKMWEEFFPNATIYGMDINPQCKKMEKKGSRIKIVTGSQSDPEFIKKFKSEVGCEFDMIVDDGSHKKQDQQYTVKELFSLVKSGGIYVIEDLGTSYVKKAYGGGGYRRKGTTIEWLKTLLDRLNYIWHQKDDEMYWSVNFRAMYVASGQCFMFKE